MALQRKTPPRGLFVGSNFMTPSILGYYLAGDHWCELSEGTGLSHQPIFGVTVKPDPEGNHSKLFYSRAAAEDYIESMIEDSERENNNV